MSEKISDMKADMAPQVLGVSASDDFAEMTLRSLLVLDDEDFIYAAYRTILNRGPDPEGLEYFQGRLQEGFSRMGVLAQLRFSREGKACRTGLPEFDAAIRQFRRTQWPVLGWFVRLYRSARWPVLGWFVRQYKKTQWPVLGWLIRRYGGAKDIGQSDPVTLKCISPQTQDIYLKLKATLNRHV
ncbi:MAG: DUF4214 domain-containing protein [Alphaproteobacteria bacterium]|nr:DUF4214 domain-containing protein [Alphaproteobacteria bacterium]